MNKISKNLKFCGIYMIINYVNNKKYIGSSIDIAQRLWTHRSELRHNKHDNQHLQNAWNKYGESNFDYVILEKCSEDIRFDREQFYVDTLKPEYNICVEVVKNPPTSVDTRKKHSETRKRLIAEGVIPITNNKPVYVYYKDGSFVGKWESVRQAAKALNMHYSSACRVIQGHDFQNNGYKLFTTEQPNIQPFRKPKTSADLRKTYIVTDGVVTLEFKGLQAVAEHFGMKKASLAQYTKGNHKIKGKYTIYRKECRAVK